MLFADVRAARDVETHQGGVHICLALGVVDVLWVVPAAQAVVVAVAAAVVLVALVAVAGGQ